MLEKSDETIKNGQSRYIGNVGYTIHRKQTLKKPKDFHQAKKMSNTDTTNMNPDTRVG